jgi:hypothetical protein
LVLHLQPLATQARFVKVSGISGTAALGLTSATAMGAGSAATAARAVRGANKMSVVKVRRIVKLECDYFFSKNDLSKQDILLIKVEILPMKLLW